jgi:hypothetical protein
LEKKNSNIITTTYYTQKEYVAKTHPYTHNHKNSLSLSLSQKNLLFLVLEHKLARAQHTVAVPVAEQDVTTLSVLGLTTHFVLTSLEEHEIEKKLITENKCLVLRGQGLVGEFDGEDIVLREELSHGSETTTRSTFRDSCNITDLVLTGESTHGELEIAAELGASSETCRSLNLSEHVLRRERFVREMQRRCAVSTKARNLRVSECVCCGGYHTDLVSLCFGRTSSHNSDTVETTFTTCKAS